MRMGEDKARVAAYILEALLDLPLVRAGRAVDLVDRVLRAHRATGGWFASDGARGHGRTGWSRRAGQQRERCCVVRETERKSESERASASEVTGLPRWSPEPFFLSCFSLWVSRISARYWLDICICMSAMAPVASRALGCVSWRFGTPAAARSEVAVQ